VVTSALGEEGERKEEAHVGLGIFAGMEEALAIGRSFKNRCENEAPGGMVTQPKYLRKGSR